MATPSQMTDFLQEGLAANRPASMNVPSGSFGIYYSTDTGAKSLWDPSSSSWQNFPASAASPSIVQSGAASTAVTGVTLGGAPANGNLLIAFCFGGGTTPAAGWSYVVPRAGVFTKFCDLMFKIAGAGESTTQTPASSGVDNILIYEVTNTPNLGNDNFGSQNTTAAAATLPSSHNSTGLILGAAMNISDGTFPTSVTGATIDAQHANSTTDSITGFHAATAGGGSNTLTINSASSKIWGWMLLALFP